MRREGLPLPWEAPLPLRACELCNHGLTHPDTQQRLCRCPAVIGSRHPQSVDVMRATHGPCGPDAIFLDFPGLHP